MNVIKHDRGPLTLLMHWIQNCDATTLAVCRGKFNKEDGFLNSNFSVILSPLLKSASDKVLGKNTWQKKLYTL